MESGSAGDAEQPIGKQLSLSDGSGLRCQHHERSLKRVFGVLAVGQEALAHIPNQRPMPAQKRRKRRLVPACNKPP
jgi:hypothetical protein